MKEKLINIQQELKAPKNQHNDFGNYYYRSCEDILEAVKPLLKANDLVMRITDELIQVGERYYVKATVILTDGKETIENVAYAREEETKKGMDGSQITGASSSYARKYALNGLFLIDDVKDSDTTNVGNTNVEPTLEDVEKYVINFGKKHSGELLIDVYKKDYNFIEWAYENRQDEYFKKCVDLLDKAEPTKEVPTDDERLKLVVEFEKLIISTKTSKEELYKYYNVQNNTEMSEEQLKEAIDIMKKKEAK